jgi:hypothetical protein
MSRSEKEELNTSQLEKAALTWAVTLCRSCQYLVYTFKGHRFTVLCLIPMRRKLESEF